MDNTRWHAMMMAAALTVMAGILSMTALPGCRNLAIASPARSLLVLNGNDGDAPALCLLNGRNAWVLHCGGYDASRKLPETLRQRGIFSIRTMTVPTPAPIPEHAARIFEAMPVDNLFFLVNPRGRAPWRELASRQEATGGSVKWMKLKNGMASFSMDEVDVSYSTRPYHGFDIECLAWNSVERNESAWHLCMKRDASGVTTVVLDDRQVMEIIPTNRGGIEILALD